MEKIGTLTVKSCLLNEIYPWMNDDQYECLLMLCDLVGGYHHLDGKIKPYSSGIEYNTWHTLATYDLSRLTRLVVMAHDRMIRAEIRPSGPGMIKITLFKRHTREGSPTERHPTIETAIEGIRAGKGY